MLRYLVRVYVLTNYQVETVHERTFKQAFLTCNYDLISALVRLAFIKTRGLLPSKFNVYTLSHIICIVSPLQLSHILSWSPAAPVTAISFFSRMYPQHPLTHQYTVRVLTDYAPETLLFYVPQLVQGTRYDKVGCSVRMVLLECFMAKLLI